MATATVALRAHCRRWRELTQAEGHAIAAGNWDELIRLQDSKLQLQHFITAAVAELSAGDLRREFHPVATELRHLEQANWEALATQCDQAHRQFAQLDASLRALQGVQRAYAGPGEPAWHSYS